MPIDICRKIFKKTNQQYSYAASAVYLESYLSKNKR